MTRPPLPGEMSSEARTARAIRVDHAGEYGAKRIYEGQLAVLKGKPSYPVIEEMRDQELQHLQSFERWMRERRVRPTALLPLWHVGGYLLGAATAMLGERAAMACTVAVEEVIGGHYARQERELGEEETALKADIARFRADEMAHLDTGLAHGAASAPAYPVLRRAVGGIARAAIWLSERV